MRGRDGRGRGEFLGCFDLALLFLGFELFLCGGLWFRDVVAAPGQEPEDVVARVRGEQASPGGIEIIFHLVGPLRGVFHDVIALALSTRWVDFPDPVARAVATHGIALADLVACGRLWVIRPRVLPDIPRCLLVSSPTGGVRVGSAVYLVSVACLVLILEAAFRLLHRLL